MVMLNNYSFVFASSSENETDDVTSDEAYHEFLKDKSAFGLAMLNLLGYVGDTVDSIFGSERLGSLVDDAIAESGYLSYEQFVRDNWNNNNTPNDTSDDHINISKEFVANFNVEFNKYIQETQGWYIEPATTQSRKWLLNHMKYYGNVTDNYTFLEPIFESTSYGFLELTLGDRSNWPNSGYVCEYVDTKSSDVYFVKRIPEPSAFPNGFGFSVYDKDLKSVSVPSIKIGGATYGYGNTYRMDGPISDPNLGRISYYVFFEDTKIFSGPDALNDYLYGNKSIYIMSDISSRIEEMRLGVNAFKYDWEKANKDSLDAILKAIQANKTELNVDTLTEQQLQDVVDSAISSRLEAISKDIASLNNANSHQNQLIYEKLEQIYQLLTKWYNSQDVDDIIKDPAVDVSLEGVVNGLDSILEELKAIHNSINDIDLNVINNNTFNTEFDIDIMMQMQPSVEKMKSTFPFCLPWDVYYCFNSLAASPVAPHWVLPLSTPVGDFEIDVDLAPFQMLSDISRALLTLTFVVYLGKFTLKIWEVL